VLALVGAGGKSTLMQRLAAEGTQRGARVLVTTTTHMWTYQARSFPHWVRVASLEEALTKARVGPFPLALTGGRESAGTDSLSKVSGLPPEWIDALVAKARPDLVVVEADGSRERPLKAPGPYEPVIPQSTTHVVLLIGWQGVGRPLDEHTVHRFRRFARLTSLSPGAPITVEALVRLVTHPEGGLKGRPATARAVLFVNQLDKEIDLVRARDLARQVITAAMGKVDEVLLGSLHRSRPVYEVHGRVGAVVLAAGAATRFGGAKQVALWRGKPLIHHVLDAVVGAEVDEVVVVLGAYREQVTGAIRGWTRKRGISVPMRVVVNPDWASGQSSSVKAGVRALGTVHGALFPLADQPRLTSDLLDALIQEHRRTLASIVAPRYGEAPGAPVLFDVHLFPELLTLQGDTGGRVLIRRHTDNVHWLAWSDTGVAWDVDTLEDLQEPPLARMRKEHEYSAKSPTADDEGRGSAS